MNILSLSTPVFDFVSMVLVARVIAYVNLTISAVRSFSSMVCTLAYRLLPPASCLYPRRSCLAVAVFSRRVRPRARALLS